MIEGIKVQAAVLRETMRVGVVFLSDDCSPEVQCTAAGVPHVENAIHENAQRQVLRVLGTPMISRLDLTKPSSLELDLHAMDGEVLRSARKPR